MLKVMPNYVQNEKKGGAIKMNQIFLGYMSYSHIIIFAVCFLILEKVYKQKVRIICIYILALIVGGIIGFFYSTLDLLVLFILFFVLSYSLFPKKNSMQIILSIVCSAVIELAFTPLYLLMMPCFFKLESEFSKSIVFLLVVLLTLFFCIVISVVLRDKLYPYLIKRKWLNSLSFFLMIIMLGYQMIEITIRYAENRNLFFMLLISYCLLIGLIIMVIHTLSQKALVEAKALKNEIISELQKNYVDEVKKQYQEIQRFRHDYTNLLSSVNYYLVSNKIEELKDFLANDIMKTSTVLKENGFILDALQNIESLGIRSIFYTKLLLAQEKNIDVHMEIQEFIPEMGEADAVSLVRIFGIFLDNAIEELETIGKGSLNVVVFMEQRDTVYIIQNTAREIIEPLRKLRTEGFSTRGKSRGLGLSNVNAILLNEPHILLETKIGLNEFVQKITIVGEVG